ncbi:MAG: hypothetical protein COC06_02325 [Bacteroidales bacterium]|nr:MAG: hypothetical protein COC06_02325 [Bacteroidales bacterium]
MTLFKLEFLHKTRQKVKSHYLTDNLQILLESNIPDMSVSTDVFDDLFGSKEGAFAIHTHFF